MAHGTAFVQLFMEKIAAAAHALHWTKHKIVRSNPAKGPKIAMVNGHTCPVEERTANFTEGLNETTEEGETHSTERLGEENQQEEECIDCKLSSFSGWTPCTNTCGKRYRRRIIEQSPNFCGEPCLSLEETQDCERCGGEIQCCPLDPAKDNSAYVIKAHYATTNLTSLTFGSPTIFFCISETECNEYSPPCNNSSPNGECQNGALLETWLDIPGKSISDLVDSAEYPQNPTETSTLQTMLDVSSQGNSLGNRLTTYLFAPIDAYVSLNTYA